MGRVLERCPATARDTAEALSLLSDYAGWLVGPAIERGLLGPREAERVWDRHLLNCASSAELLQPGEVLLDLGSGAGLPGVVLAILRPDVTVVLVEPLLRRAEFLSEVTSSLGLRTATVRRARAEDLAGAVLCDVVVARAVAPLERLAGWALPLLRPGGRLLALKGDRADDELAAAGPLPGALSAEVATVGEGATLARLVLAVRAEASTAPAARVRAPRPRRGVRTSR